MLFHDQTFEERIRFFQLNVCDFPEELTCGQIDQRVTQMNIAAGGNRDIQQICGHHSNG